MSDAGRSHIVLEDIYFDVDAHGEDIVSLENDVHASLYCTDAKYITNVRVSFQLAENIHRGQKKPLKAIKVKVKLAS